MSDLIVQSHRGPYAAHFSGESLDDLFRAPRPNAHYIVDQNVAKLYAKALRPVLETRSVLRLEATERAKTLECFTGYVEHLVASGIRRGDTLVAIGGGVIQDIVCFLGATLLRGIDWEFYPTTLLAQADSCIGSKSSINVGSAKNVLGTYTPPKRIVINVGFLDTLSEWDRRSGVGEMLKVHAIEGPAAFNRIASEYSRLFLDKGALIQYLRDSLEIKRRIVEVDEFDRGPRNVMNYGHTFGHAIESATDYAIPHGIAVTIGMDMANFVAWKLGLSTGEIYFRMRPTLAANYKGYESTKVPFDSFLAAIGKDKKNTKDQLGLILPDGEGRVAKRFCSNNEEFRASCEEYLAHQREPLPLAKGQ